MQLPMPNLRSASFLFLLLDSVSFGAVLNNNNNQRSVVAAKAHQQQLRALGPHWGASALATEESSDAFKAALADFVRFEGNNSPAPPRVVVQVPEKELNNFTKLMSKRCESQLLDARSSLHTFGEGTSENETTCTELNGTLCSVVADINAIEEQEGRQMSSSTKVHGASCLPVACMEPTDLKALVDFMQAKAQGAFGSQTSVAMSVDCSAGGGGLVDIEGNPDILSKQAAVERSSARGSVSLLGLMTPVAALFLFAA